MGIHVLAPVILRWRTEHFQAKWTPVRVKKMRENKNLEHFHVSMKRENALGMASPGILSGRLAGRSLFS
jgi:hypothetical protein